LVTKFSVFNFIARLCKVTVAQKPEEIQFTRVENLKNYKTPFQKSC